MFRIGCHLSVSKGFYAMGKEALSINANTMQFFTRNPRGGKAKEIDLDDVEKFKLLCEQNNIAQFLAHAPYTLNPCSATEQTRIFAEQTMADDLKRLSVFSECLYNFHPGSHVGQGAEKGIEMITALLNKLLTHEQNVTVLLETMAGKGSEVGKSFEELNEIIKGVEIKEKMGVCLDTCHVHDAGYDIKNNPEKVLEEFDKIIGINYLKAVHLNDSMNPVGAHKDRHEKIGEGYLGIEAFEKIINLPELENVPFFLETPNELDGYAKEIALLKSLRA